MTHPASKTLLDTLLTRERLRTQMSSGDHKSIPALAVSSPPCDMSPSLSGIQPRSDQSWTRSGNGSANAAYQLDDRTGVDTTLSLGVKSIGLVPTSESVGDHEFDHKTPAMA